VLRRNEKELAKQNCILYLALFTLVIFGLIIFLLRKTIEVRKTFNAILRLKNKALGQKKGGLNLKRNK